MLLHIFWWTKLIVLKQNQKCGWGCYDFGDCIVLSYCSTIRSLNSSWKYRFAARSSFTPTFCRNCSLRLLSFRNTRKYWFTSKELFFFLTFCDDLKSCSLAQHTEYTLKPQLDFPCSQSMFIFKFPARLRCDPKQATLSQFSKRSFPPCTQTAEAHL